MSVGIFVNNLRYERVNYHELRDILSRIIVITNKEFFDKIPKKYIPFINRFIISDNITELLIKQTVLEEKKISNDIFLSTVDEEFVVPCANLRSEFNLYGSKDLLHFRDKKIMKDRLKESCKLPKYEVFNTDNIPKEGYPYILKPIGGFGSINTHKVLSYNELLKITSQLNLTQKYLLEKYIEGQLFHCDSVVINNEIIFAGICKYIGNGLSLINDGFMGAILINEKYPLYNKIMDFNKTVLKNMGLSDGVTHCEFFINHRNEIIFLEIAARPPGAEVTNLYKLVYGIDMFKTAILIDISKLEKALYCSEKKETEYSFAGYMYIAKKNGVVTEINIPVLNAVYSKVDLKIKIGEAYNNSCASYDRAIGIIVADNNKKNVDDIINNTEWNNCILWN